MNPYATGKRIVAALIVAAIALCIPLVFVLAAAPERTPVPPIDPQTQALIRALADQNSLASWATLVTSIIGFLSLIAGFIWKGWSDNRSHRWLLEATLKGATAKALAENTRLTVESAAASATALDAANHVNEKIANLYEQIGQSNPQPPK